MFTPRQVSRHPIRDTEYHVPPGTPGGRPFGRNADGTRLDAFEMPVADTVDQHGEFGFPGGNTLRLATLPYAIA